MIGWLVLAFCGGGILGVVVMACAKVSGACERCAECRERIEREAWRQGYLQGLAAERGTTRVEWEVVL